ncbi:hypothetical protein D8674_004065 [Pyrus ussuriensis x Pyrus communis]|uniref:Uncharacterized protein n=1 Tax=Pyrus ussuriensis x Pyrus communis TaxID=2448454 RepID=A0A5N5FP17_9ROSA|nr:hypothetical protein D8674_004065 [Pyrus ussuriensis x Pyrus communis]
MGEGLRLETMEADGVIRDGSEHGSQRSRPSIHARRRKISKNGMAEDGWKGSMNRDGCLKKSSEVFQPGKSISIVEIDGGGQLRHHHGPAIIEIW